MIYKSRYTVGAKGYEIPLKIGEECVYRLLDGSTVKIKINSERMTHERCKTYGYESIFIDDGGLGFADGDRIVWWEGINENKSVQ